MNLKIKRTNELTAAQAIVDGAKSRELTRAETATIERHVNEIKSIDVQIKAVEESQRVAHQIGEMGLALDARDGTGFHLGLGGQKFGAPAGLSSFGATETDLRGMHSLLKTGSPATIEMPGRMTKAAILNPSVVPQVQSDFIGGIYVTANSLLDLFPHKLINAPTVRVYRTSTNASVAAVTAEGAAKPDAGLIIGSADVSVSKIAATQKISEELIADFPTFVQSIGAEVTQAVKTRENAWGAALLLAGGIATQAGGAGVTVIDAVANTLAVQQAAGITATAVVLSPADLAKVRTSKASTGGSYFIDPLGAGPQTLFGLPVVSTPSLTLNTVLVGDFAGAGFVGVRDAMTVAVGYDADDWSKNLRILRVEERLLLALTMPAKITKVTLSLITAFGRLHRV